MEKNGKAKRKKSKRFSFVKPFLSGKVNSDSDESSDESTSTKAQSGICDQIDTEKRPLDKIDSNESPEHIPTEVQESRIPQVSIKPLYSNEKDRELHVKHDYGCENIVERLPKCKDKYVKDPNRKPNAEKDLKDAVENGNSDDYPDFPYIDSETSDDGQHISHNVITTEHSRQDTNEIDICNEGKDAAQILVDVVLESNGVIESYHSYKSEDSTKPADVPLKQDIEIHMPTEDTYRIEKHVTDENCHIKGNAALSHSNNIDDITDQSIECRTVDSIVGVNASLKESDQIDSDEESMNEHVNMTDITKKSPTEEQEKEQREFSEVHNNQMIEKNETQSETDTSTNDSSWPNDANYSGKSIESSENKLQNKGSEHESSTQKEYETGNVVDENGLEISIQASNDNDFNFETDAEKTHSSYSKASENVSFEIHNRMTDTSNIEETNKQNDHEKENQMSQDNKSDTNSDQNDADKVNMHEHIDTTDITEKSPTEKLEEFSEIHIHQMNEPNTSKTQDEDVGGEETDTSTNNSGSSNDANYSVNISVAEEENKSHQQGLQSYSPVAESSIEGTYKMSNLSKENKVPQDHTPETNSVTVTTLSDGTTLNDSENTAPIHIASSEDKTKITEGAESVPNGSGHYDVSNIIASQDRKEQDTQAFLLSEMLPPFSDNIRFYQNEIHSRPAIGYKIEDMLQWFGDYEKLERNHTYIHWLFPITESSRINYQAQKLYDHEAEYIKNHEELKNRVFQSFEMMLDFYGMAIVNGEFCRNKINWEARYTHLNESFHNQMRITRIIRCLGEVGYEKLQTKWLSFIMKEAMVSKKLYKLGGNCMEYFIDAIKEDTDREKVCEKYFRYVTRDYSVSDEENDDTSQCDNCGETNENMEEVTHAKNDHEINSHERDLGNRGCRNTANGVGSNDTEKSQTEKQQEDQQDLSEVHINQMKDTIASRTQDDDVGGEETDSSTNDIGRSHDANYFDTNSVNISVAEEENKSHQQGLKPYSPVAECSKEGTDKTDRKEQDTQAVLTTEILPPFSDNIRFYQNEIHSRPAVGYKIENMLQWFGDYETLERNLTYIHWLFPITESSRMNYQAQRLYDHEAEYIKNHEELKNRVFQSFEMMLDFYGMAIVNGEFCRNKINWEARYTHLNESFHNRMRITRIIRCLGEVGYEKLQTKWLSFIMKEAMVSKKLYILGGNCMEYFIDAIKEDTDRKKVYEKYFRYVTGDFSESDEENDDTSQCDNRGETNENMEEVKHAKNDHEINSHERDLGNLGCRNTANGVGSNDSEKLPTEMQQKDQQDLSEVHINQMKETNASKTQDDDVGGEETDSSPNDSGRSHDANYFDTNSVYISVAEEENKSHQQGLQPYSPVAESIKEGTDKMNDLSRKHKVPQDQKTETYSVTVTTFSDVTTLNDLDNTKPTHTASSEDKTKITEGAESVPNGSRHYDVSNILASHDRKEQDTQAVLTTEILPPFSDNIRFYQNEIHSRPAVGYKIEDMLQWFGDYEKLERNHTYIHWLFPITESSGMNYQAQRLYDHEAEYIKTHEELKNRVFHSFEMMLDFYGMAIVNGEFCRNETNWEARYTHLNESFHNRMRITRIIRCLGEVGYEKLQTKWLSFIMKEAMVSKKLYKLGGYSIEYFIDAIKEDTDREKVYEKYFKYMTGDFSESDEEKDTSQTDNGGETSENMEEVKHVQNDHEINSDESDLGNQGCINTANDVRSNDTVDGESHNKKTNTLNVNNDLGDDEFVAEIEGNGFQNHMHEKSNSNKLLSEEANINTTGNEEYQDDYEGSTESRDPVKAGLENFANADYGVDHADEKSNGMKNMTVVDNNSDENKVNAEINERDNNGLYHPAHDEQPNDKVEEEKLNRNTNMTKENGSSQYELDSHDNPRKYEDNTRISEDDNSNLESIADDVYSSNRENNENDLKIPANDGQVNDEETLNKKTNSTERNAHLYNDECNNYTGESGDDTLGNVVEDKQNIYDIQPFGKTNVNTEGEQGNQGNHDKTNLDYSTNGMQSWDKDCEEKIFNETNMTDEHDSENETESTTKTGESSNNCFDSYNNSKQSGDGENVCETNIANVDDDGRSQEHRYGNTETYYTGKHSLKSPASDEPSVDYGDDHDDEILDEMKDMVEDNTNLSASDNIGPENTANGEQSNDNFNDENFNSNTNIAIEMDNRYEFNSYGDVSDDNGKVNFAIDEQFEYEEKLKVMPTTKKEHANPIDQTDNAYLSERENTNSGHTDIGGQNNDGDDKHTAETTNEVTNGDGCDADEHGTYSNNLGASDDDDYTTAEEDNIGMYEKMSNIANNYISNSDQEVTGPEGIGDCENIDAKGISSKEHYQSVTSVSEIDNISGNNIYKSGENISKGSDSGPEDIGDCENIDAKGISSKEHYQSVTSVSEIDNISGNNIYKSGENISKGSESDSCNTNNLSPDVTITSDDTESHDDVDE
ncbi:Opioid growth factor receptor-like protein 1 [Mactra antiquata]